ncbi:ROK family protein [Pseudonocardia sp. ICBG1293]|uniref:ROK family protein n=1 Tax=Pseudonocardia sp. ICBG1293 TaxID=2844382 RepID=UPI001CCA77B5|nr:ROK family protein [Pseudonocardia sp. ICBG1293]
MTSKPLVGPLRLSAPPVAARLDAAETASVLSRLVASRAATTKADLCRATGLARSTVTSAVDALLSRGVLDTAGTRTPAGRGRPADELVVSPRHGVVLLADLGVERARVTVAGLGQQILQQSDLEIVIADGPERVLATVAREAERMLGTVPYPVPRAAVIGLPGPVDPSGGRPVRPPIMPGWDGYPVADVLGERFGCDTVVANDVNLCALGEARSLPPEQSPLLFVTIGAGIGGGFVGSNGEVHQGSDGAAGDIGHIRLPGTADVACACGKTGCVEAVASATALAGALLREGGHRPGGETELVALIRAGEPAAVRLLREATVVLGELVAMLVHVLNPARVVLGGELVAASDDILAGVRGLVYQRALPLATRDLVLAQSGLASRAATAGALVQAIEAALSAEALERGGR